MKAKGLKKKMTIVDIERIKEENDKKLKYKNDKKLVKKEL